MFFTEEDLVSMISLLKNEHEGNDFGYGELEEESIQKIAKKMIESLGIREKKIFYRAFLEVVKSNEEILEIYQIMGNGLKALLAYQGENIYSKTVKVVEGFEKEFGNFKNNFCEILDGLEEESLQEEIEVLQGSNNKKGEFNKILVKLQSTMNMEENENIQKIQILKDANNLSRRKSKLINEKNEKSKNDEIHSQGI